MINSRNWKIGRAGEYYRSGGHGPVKILVEGGVIVNRVARLDSRDDKYPAGEKIVYPAASRMPENEIERRLKALRIRVK